MTDLDIQIDVPDDDDLDSPVRVLNGDWMPPWLKAAAVLIIGLLVALAIGAFLLGRSRADGAEESTPPESRTTSLASAADSPAIESSLEAVQAWEAFARTGDLAAVAETFEIDGPQYRLFEAAAPGPVEDLDFAARNMTETAGDGLTTVSLDLVVSGAEGQQVYPFDLVYLDGRERVWTVVDRRSPGQAALPPAAADIEQATDRWTSFTSALATGDGAGIEAAVTDRTLALADQVSAAADGQTVDRPLVADPDVFAVLVERQRAAGAERPGDVVIGLLDQDQRQTLLVGQLTSWIRTDPDKIIASLEVAGEPVTTVPFVASATGWTFDLVGAMETSGGNP